MELPVGVCVHARAMGQATTKAEIRQGKSTAKPWGRRETWRCPLCNPLVTAAVARKFTDLALLPFRFASAFDTAKFRRDTTRHDSRPGISIRSSSARTDPTEPQNRTQKRHTFRHTAPRKISGCLFVWPPLKLDGFRGETAYLLYRSSTYPSAPRKLVRLGSFWIWCAKVARVCLSVPMSSCRYVSMDGWQIVPADVHGSLYRGCNLDTKVKILGCFRSEAHPQRAPNSVQTSVPGLSTTRTIHPS